MTKTCDGCACGASCKCGTDCKCEKTSTAKVNCGARVDNGWISFIELGSGRGLVGLSA
ncbi:16320_t:CDS:2 [Entrophospora sp. SA101]|nr:16320_t:CDS:2 [Entrophospora sp. SA101]